MRLNLLLIGFIFSAFTALAMAGNQHDHDSDHGHSHSQVAVDDVTASANATNIVATLVEKGKLDKSWASITATSVEKQSFEGKEEWVISFVNAEVTDLAKQKLYVFLAVNGEYIAANYTGK
tara:strand:+ start:93869 stop:94231 length:363 start_codon:yes stop_codon:yes gene_type:complete